METSVALARAEGVLDSVVDGKAVLIGSAGTHVVDLNAIGTLVWSSLDGTRELADLVELVRTALDDPQRVPAQRVEADVVAFLDELRRLELVQG
jgi:hypothetical protein